nr:At2g36640 [Arabidopsis thaliana]BAC42987.1 putative f13k3 late embryogenesis abundant protein AtECP63 [Arabidopsis thaliana]
MEKAGEVTRQKMEEMRLEGKELKEEAGAKAQEASQKTRESTESGAQKAEETKDSAAVRGNEAKGTIFGALGNVTEAIKSKLTMPSDIVEETRAAREHGGTGRTVVEVKVEDSKPGKVATSLKASDQMTGQTFNDVGRMDDDARKDKGKL